MKKMLLAVIAVLLLVSVAHAEEYVKIPSLEFNKTSTEFKSEPVDYGNWFAGLGYAWYGHNTYAKSPIYIIGWQNQDLEIKYLYFGKIATRRTHAIKTGLKFDPFVVGLMTTYSKQVNIADTPREIPQDGIQRKYFTTGPYFGFQVDRPRYTIQWTYFHSIKVEDVTAHAEIMEVLFKF